MLITIVILRSFLQFLIMRESTSTSIARRSQGEHHTQRSKRVSSSRTTVLGVVKLHADLSLGALIVQALMTFQCAGAAV